MRRKLLYNKMAVVLAILLTFFVAIGIAAEERTDGVSTTGIADEPLITQIDEYFNMTREEIIGALGSNFSVVPAGPEGVCDGYLYEDLGMAFAFYPDSEILDSIDCYPNFKIHGVGIGNRFSEIMEALGDTEIVETWLELPIYTVYMVRYRLGNSEFSFIAFEEDAPVDSLWIHQTPDIGLDDDEKVFALISGNTFSFLSGVGGWSTEVVMSEDGSFTGHFHDSDMGDIGDGYPEGTRYECFFSGAFVVTQAIDQYTYELRLVALDIEEDTGVERIVDGVRVISADAYGMEGGDVFMLYCPGKKTSDLSEDFLEWMCMPNAWEKAPETLPFYGLYNVDEGTGFFSSFVKDTSPGGVPADAQAYAGLWHASPVLGSGFSVRLALNDDFTFLWAASEMDGLERVRFRSGAWTVDNGNLWLTVEDEVRWEGGREVSALGSMATETEIVDAEVVTSKLTIPAVEQYEVSLVKEDAKFFDCKTVTIGVVQYWELAHPMDLESLYDDFRALKGQTVETIDSTATALCNLDRGTDNDFSIRLSGSIWLGDECEYPLKIGSICLFCGDEKESIPYRWRYHISDESMMRFFHSEYEISAKSRPVPGGDAGWRRLYFEALNPGECEVAFRYGRYGDDWEDEWDEEYRYTIVITSK